MRVVPEPNGEQRRAWGGPAGGYWAAHADRYDAGVAGYADAFAAGAAVAPGERVLDVGCGAGTTTRDAARAAGPGGHAHGVDLSPRLVGLARERAAGAANVTFAVADAQVDDLGDAAADVVISRHGVMFVDDPAALLANLHRALRPGGRLALLVWQQLERQEWLRSFLDALGAPHPPADRPSPVAFGDPDRVHRLLAGTGFTGVEQEAVHRPMWFGTDADDAAAFIGGQFAGFLDGLPDDGRRRARRALHRVMAEHQGPGGVRFASACRLVRARR